MLTAREERILRSIKVPSENDPKRPEFPPDKPHFPATPTNKISVPGFSNVWLKDDSVNPTGTHKDRMAWEIVVTYRHFLQAKRAGYIQTLPQMSLISHGSAAIAVQTMLRKYGLPSLKILVDPNLAEEKVLRHLKKLGCEIFETDLSRKALVPREILFLTNNLTGIDVTSDESLGPNTRFYDWMSYEIINNSPEYVFVPFGTGQLYENILNINKTEVARRTHDPRFSGDVDVLKKCNFIGATTNNPRSKADKLYSPHLPFVHYDEHWISFYKTSGYCGPGSAVYVVKEEFLDKAMELAKKEGISCEPSGIAGLALMLQMKDKLPKNRKYLIVNTGKTKMVGE